jgi:hypothetical protein
MQKMHKNIVNHSCEWHAELSFENKILTSCVYLFDWHNTVSEETAMQVILPSTFRFMVQGLSYLAGT